MLGIYNAEGFLHSIGGSDDWDLTPGGVRPFRRWNKRIFPVLKRKLKKQFNKIYNSNDISYIDEESSSDRASREEVERLRLQFSIDWPQWSELTPPVSNMMVFTNPMCYAEERGVEGVDGLSVGTGPSPDAGSPDADDTTGDDAAAWEPPDLDLVCATYTWDATPYASAGSHTEIMLRETAFYVDTDPAYSSVTWEDAPGATWYDLSPGINDYGTQGVIGYGHPCYEGDHTYTDAEYDDFYHEPGNRGFAHPAAPGGDIAVCLRYRRASDMSTPVQRLVYGTPADPANPASRGVWGSAPGNAYNLAYLNDAAEETIEIVPASECPDIEGG